MLISLVSVVVVIIPGSDQYPEQATESPAPYYLIVRDDDFDNTGDNHQAIDPFHFPSFFLIVCNCFKSLLIPPNFAGLHPF